MLPHYVTLIAVNTKATISILYEIKICNTKFLVRLTQSLKNK